MRCNTRWILNPAELAHSTGPRLSAMRRQLKSDIDVTTVSLGLYFCVDSSTGRTTLLTFGLGSLHQHVCEQCKSQDDQGRTKRESTNPLGDPFSLILAWCRGLMWEFEEIATLWYQRDEIYVSPIALLFHFRTSGLNPLCDLHSQSEKVMQASNHGSNLKAAEFRHRMAVYTRDWLTSFEDSLVEIRKQHLVFMSDIFAHRNGAQANARFIEHVDEQFGRLIVRSKDVERVMHGVVETTRERVHVVRLFLFLGQSNLSIHVNDYSATRICQSASRHRPSRCDPRKCRTGGRNSLTRDRQQAGWGDYEDYHGRHADLSACYVRCCELPSVNDQRAHAANLTMHRPFSGWEFFTGTLTRQTDD